MANEQLDKEFIQQQKGRLEELKAELNRMIDGMEEDERQRAEDEGDLTEHDSGDLSQSQFTRNLDATVGERTERRLEEVNRALEKIGEGTYGVCDDTGEEISKGRLEAMPEAVRTVEAQEQRDR